MVPSQQIESGDGDDKVTPGAEDPAHFPDRHFLGLVRNAL